MISDDPPKIYESIYSLFGQGRVDHHDLAAGRGVCEEPRGQDQAGGRETQG